MTYWNIPSCNSANYSCNSFLLTIWILFIKKDQFNQHDRYRFYNPLNLLKLRSFIWRIYRENKRTVIRYKYKIIVI